MQEAVSEAPPTNILVYQHNYVIEIDDYSYEVVLYDKCVAGCLELPATATVTSWADVRCHASLPLFPAGMFSHFSDNSGPETEGFAAFTMDGPPRKRYSMA